MRDMAPNPLPGTTPDRIRWTYRLIEREAAGEQLPEISKQAWREVLGYPMDTDAKAALEAIKAQRTAA